MNPIADTSEPSAVTTAGAAFEESPEDMPEIPTAPSPEPSSQELTANAPEGVDEGVIAADSDVSDVSTPSHDPANVSKKIPVSSKNECPDLNETLDVSSDGSTTDSGNDDDGWDENDPIKEIEAQARSKKRVFYRHLLCVAAVAVACIAGVATGLTIISGNNAQISSNAASSTNNHNVDGKGEGQAGPSTVGMDNLSANGDNDKEELALCAAINEKAVECGANAKADRHTFCCPGLVCQVDRYNVYPKSVCVEPPTEPMVGESDGEDDAEDLENVEVEGEEPTEADEANFDSTVSTVPMDEEVDENTDGETTEDETTSPQEPIELPIVLQDEEFCGTDRVRAVECGNEANENRPSKCCDGYICRNAERDTFAPVCVIDPNGLLAASLTVLEDPKAYQPGHLLTTKNGVLLSAGLDCRILATKGQKVKQFNKDKTSVLYKSLINFHSSPDFGATFPTDDGGWVYVSNSEVQRGGGGVGAFKFGKNGNVINYRMLLEGTSMNCGGGRTPWGTWISCEEVNDEGQIWEVHPEGKRNPKKTVLGGFDKNGTRTGGRFESFTYDIRDKEVPKFYYTEDHPQGALRQFIPKNFTWDKPHHMLHGDGDIKYLVLTSTSANNATGTYHWTSNKQEGMKTAAEFFPGSEGIDVYEGMLFFVTKKRNLMYTLDLDSNTWERRSTKHGAFDGSPDQLARMVGEEEILYYTEEGGRNAGIHARDAQGRFFTILESPVYEDESTGLAFCPDGMHLYVAYQRNGVLLDVWRKDKKPFTTKTLNIKYHNTGVTFVE